jgi:L-aminopeptidase/D-esterase-like protein
MFSAGRSEGTSAINDQPAAGMNLSNHPEASGDDSILDVGGLRVGHWTNRRAATGCTVVLCPPEGAIAAVDVRGGAPGTRETDLLAPGQLVQRIHAVLLSGGSAFGLDAATGIMRFLEEQGTGFRMGKALVPIVVGAVVFDLGTGRSDIRPDAESGYRACQAARARTLAQGSIGAGAGATVAKLGGPGYAVKGGIGSASERLAGGLIVGALAAVNAVGEIVDPSDGRLLAARRAADGEPIEGIEFLRGRPRRTPEPGTNTTIATVATNAALTKEQTLRLATMAHAGFARTIRPSHTPADGDTIFALATGALSVEESDLLPIGALATRALERAILRGVLRAKSLAGVPSVQDLTTQE